MVVQIAITNNDIIQYPVLVDDVKLSQYRRGSPSKLKFTIIKDSSLDVQEGNSVLLQVDGTSMFYGFVFEKSRKGSTSNKVEITAYDQLRYLKNKDTFSYKATADELIRMIASKYYLSVGELAQTGYKLSRVESSSALLDIIETALDETVYYTGNLYTLYDNVGKLTLSNIEALKLPLLVDASGMCDYTYKTSIDKDTYNQVKVLYETHESTVSVAAKDDENIKKWGVLQLLEKAQGVSPAAKAQSLLKLYNDTSRTLTLSSVIGDTRVHGGTSIVVKLDLGDMALQNYMLVEEATHKFKNGIHLMDLKVRGGSFVV